MKRLRRREKWYGLMSTCLTTRLIHLTLMPSLSGESCMIALDSLAGRGLAPRAYYCDNGTNFVYAATRYRDLDGRRPEFRFNPPQSPNFGGSWERMIGMTKRAWAALGIETAMEEERLRHLFTKAEYIVNLRPLTDVPHHPRTTRALTPLMLLNGTADADQAEADQVELQWLAEERDEQIQEFWTRWTREYLPTITRRTKWTQQTSALRVGDLVFYCESDYRRGWPRGRVPQVFADPESGQVRKAMVRWADGKESLKAAVRLAKLNIRQD